MAFSPATFASAEADAFHFKFFAAVVTSLSARRSQFERDTHIHKEPTLWARIYSVWCAPRQKELHRGVSRSAEPFA